MRAVAVTALGGPDVLQVVDMPDPVAGPGQVVVRIHAAGVHPADVGARLGRLPGPPLVPPFLPGWDLAGEVVAVGEKVTGVARGDRVVGMIFWPMTRGAPGAYAELAAVDAGWVVPLPDGLDPVPAATVPLNALTARQALELMSLPDRSMLLVTGASGGVGGFAAQLAARAGHRVIGQSTYDDEDWVAGLGVDQVLSRSAELGSVGPVPAVLDAVPLGKAAADVVADGGALVTTRPTDPVEVARGVRQQLVLVQLNQPMLAELVADVAAGRLRTRVAATVPLSQAAAAHRMLESGGVRGKIVLIPD